jgi:hypothetical protein
MTRGADPSPESPEYYTSAPELEAKGIRPELLQSQLNFCFPVLGFFPCIINFTIIIILSRFLSLSLSLLFLCYNPLFSLPTTFSTPSHPLSPPVFASPSHSTPTCHHTTPPFYLCTTCWLAYCTNHTNPQPPASPDTSILHYNSRNRPKHIQGLQNPAASRPLLSPSPSCQPPLLVSSLLITQVSISSQTNITLTTPTVYRYYHQGVFYTIG